METRKRSERPKRRHVEQTTEDSISSSRSTSKIRRRKQMDGEGKGKGGMAFGVGLSQRGRNAFIDIVHVDLCENPPPEHMHTTIIFAYSRFWV